MLTFEQIAERSKEKYVFEKHGEIACVELEHIEQETGRILSTVPASSQNSIKNICTSQSVAFSKLRPYLRKFFYADDLIACSSECWVLKAKSEICSKYLYYLIQSDDFIKATNMSSGTKMPRAEWDAISRTPFTIPSLEEQERIVSILEHIDFRSDCCSKELELLHSMKKSLLQQMFI